MTIVADLHIHTQASDGLLTPYEVVKLAAAKRMKAIAVCDHDTVAGVENAQEAGSKAGINVLTGIELSTVYEEKEIHILGYCFDPTDNALTNILNTLHTSRYSRMGKMVERLQSLHFQITMADVLQKAGNAAPNRPHAARVLVEKGYFRSVSDVFSQLLDPGKPAHIKRYKLTPPEAIKIIHEAGGLTSWAHPGLVQDDGLLDRLISAGLNAVEVYHPDHSADMSRHYLNLAQKNRLAVTGGSDYHGKEAGRQRLFGTYGLGEEEFNTFNNCCEQILKNFKKKQE